MAVNDDAPEHQLSESTGAGAASGSDEDPVGTSGDSSGHAADACDNDDDAGVDADPPCAEAQPPTRTRAALAVCLATVVAFAGLGCWLGVRSYQSHRPEQQRALFLQVARQGALNLTTIDHENAESDVQRVLDSATGAFYDDFSRRSEPFIEVVKAAQAKSVGTVTEAGIEDENDDEAQVLVAVNVKTTNAGAAEQVPRAWRMRISVTRVDSQAKISNVAFVP